MESLLSLAFDNLSSFDGAKIKKGLKQVEGLLAQICLSGPSSSRKPAAAAAPATGQQQEDKTSSAAPTSPPRKVLSDLPGDPAFREFFKLQEGFEWNVAQRVLTTLDWLVARGGDGKYDLLIVNALDLIQGVLLLHPPSKSLFSRSVHMNLLLDLIEPINCPAIQSATIITLVVALLDAPHNIRIFEQLDGLLTITSLFKSRDTGREVKFRLTEFLYFYLTPETPSIPRANPAAGPGLLQRSPSKLAKVFGGGAGRVAASSNSNAAAEAAAGRDRAASESNGNTLSVETKKHYVDRYLPGVVDELLKDLDTYKPFDGVAL
ncbi:cell division protein Cdc14 [Lasiosphaeria miniovina]|uniref:Cell division protein Cdc14 n=1 Tax=Lasiosphaeria miniovina TaxID=1954250 RepID=A0AA40E540_9PEZI|nr:cell division protein Cdc14 [Lasiosphaeria miniovina]KAK0728539.1 cell division protein Cdc14 [Lasiosphaeria miniovina]